MQLTNEEKTLLFVHLLRDPDTIRSATPVLTDELFGHSELIEHVVWSISRDNFKLTGQLTPYDHLYIDVKKKLGELSFPIEDAHLAGILLALYAVPAESLSFPLILPKLREYIADHKLRQQIQEVASGETAFLELADRVNDVLRQVAIGVAQPEDLSSLGLNVFLGLERIPTGFAPFDELLGGIRKGEAVGLLGPMKGGKTSFCQSLACDMAASGRRVTYFTYEESAAQQWPKFLISCAKKHSRKLIEGKEFSSLPIEIQKDLSLAHTVLSRNLSLVDMSGAKKEQGFGGVAELIQAMDTQYRAGTLGDLVIVDHVLPMIQRSMKSQSQDMAKQTRHQVMACCDEFTNAVVRLQVAGVLAHQMDAVGNNRHVYVPSTHMDSAECKHFGMVLHDCLCLGRRDENNIALLNLSATRSSAPRHIPVHVDGEFCRIRLKSDMVFDKGTNCFQDALALKDGRRSTDSDISKDAIKKQKYRQGEDSGNV